jgi:propanol-preferring alcohol dehydrogenase
MKAIRLLRPGHPLVLREIVEPRIGPRDLLIRVRAAGICHSDAHYRAGVSRVKPLPRTLGHEVSGVVEKTGRSVREFKRGDRVCVHYLATCGQCRFCRAGTEQFCLSGKMIGKHRDGGFAEMISVPERSAFALPREISFEQGAILMCSSATAFHALKKTRLKPGETVAVFGIGGLGISAIQIAKAFRAAEVFAVEINNRKLALAKKFGAIPVNASTGDAVKRVKKLTRGRGVDVALELVGLPLTMRQAVQSLAVFGRAGLVGITRQTVELAPYVEILNRETEIIGVSDHLAAEIPPLLELTRRKRLNLPHALIRTVPLEADAVNQVLDRLEKFQGEVRTVIVP